MLLLVCEAAGQRYALDSRLVAEVVPLVPLRPVPGAPQPVSGVFTYRGAVTPVVDLCRLTSGEACREVMSTRVMVLDYPLGPGEDGVDRARPLGVIAERVTRTLRWEEGDCDPETPSVSEATYLGPMIKDPQGSGDGGHIIQLIEPTGLLSAELKRLLFDVRLPEECAL